MASRPIVTEFEYLSIEEYFNLNGIPTGSPVISSTTAAPIIFRSSRHIYYIGGLIANYE